MRPAQFKKDVKMIKTRRCKYFLQMKPKGVRIELDNACDVTLSMILSNIKNGEELHWRLFYVWAIKNGQESNLDMRLKESFIEQIILGIYSPPRAIEHYY